MALAMFGSYEVYLHFPYCSFDLLAVEVLPVKSLKRLAETFRNSPDLVCEYHDTILPSEIAAALTAAGALKIDGPFLPVIS